MGLGRVTPLVVITLYIQPRIELWMQGSTYVVDGFGVTFLIPMFRLILALIKVKRIIPEFKMLRLNYRRKLNHTDSLNDFPINHLTWYCLFLWAFCKFQTSGLAFIHKSLQRNPIDHTTFKQGRTRGPLRVELKLL